MKYFLIITLAASIISFSCKDDTVTNGDPLPATNAFPGGEGTNWRYLVVDSINNITDTLQILVNGKTTISTGEEVKIWEMTYTNTSDTNYVLYKGDSVKIFEENIYLAEYIKIVFPLSVGKGWTGDFAQDTSFVSRTTELSLPAGYFSEVFVIEREYGGLNEYKQMTIWFVPSVGIVKLNERETGFGFVKRTRELLNYEIK